MCGETSPVYAPEVSVCMFCAPSAMPLPVRIAETSVSHGKGGQTTISGPSLAAPMEVPPPAAGRPNAATSDRASAAASSREVFIFQLPTTSGLTTRPHRYRPGGESSRTLLDRLRAPALDVRKVLNQLQPVARHAQQFLFALRHAEVRRAAAWHPREIAQCADAFPVLLLADTHFGQPVGARQQRRDQLQVQLLV